MNAPAKQQVIKTDWNLANAFTFTRFALAPVCAILFLQQTYWGVCSCQGL